MVAAWLGPQRRSYHWRTVQRSGEAEGAAWEEGQPEEIPECSYGTAHQPIGEVGDWVVQDKDGMST